MPNKKKPQQAQDSIKPTYKNMGLFNKLRTQDQTQGHGYGAKTTKRDTLNYNQGFEFGLKHKAPKKPFNNEGYMFRAGRWEGQNNPSSVNKKPAVEQPGIISRAASVLKNIFND
jgi:hypothetical protein